MRIGLPMEYFFDQPRLDAEVKAAVLRAVRLLEESGAIVSEVTVPHAAEAKDANTIIIASEAGAYHRPDLQSQFDAYGRFTSESIGRSVLFSGADYVQAMRFRSYFKKAVAAVMEPLDVLVVPTSIGTATLRSEMSPGAMLESPGFTGQWNLAGLPALAIPTGLSSATLPMSMQIVGKPFDEAMVLRVGDAFQRMTSHHLNVPPIAASVAV